MAKKYFTLSFDDGLEQDKRLLGLMHKYGLKGTFNLNAGLFGTKGEVKGIGTIGFQDCEVGVRHHWPFSYVPHNRIPEDEIAQVYVGMEIASHGFRHEALGKLDEEALHSAVNLNKVTLEKLVGTQIYGYAFAQGSTSTTAQSYLKSKGYRYARLVRPSKQFDFPAEPLALCPTCSCIDKDTPSLVERFIKTEAEERDLLFYMWGHSYEFDYEKGQASWLAVERLFERIASQNDIIFCTNIEAIGGADIC